MFSKKKREKDEAPELRRRAGTVAVPNDPAARSKFFEEQAQRARALSVSGATSSSDLPNPATLPAPPPVPPMSPVASRLSNLTREQVLALVEKQSPKKAGSASTHGVGVFDKRDSDDEDPVEREERIKALLERYSQ